MPQAFHSLYFQARYSLRESIFLKRENRMDVPQIEPLIGEAEYLCSPTAVLAFLHE